MRTLSRLFMPAAAALALSSCGTTAPEIQASLQRTRAGAGHGDSTYISTHLLMTDAHGAPLACEDYEVLTRVRVSFDGGVSWTTLSDALVSVECDDADGDLAVVLDNSGSTSGVLTDLQDAAVVLTDPVYKADGRVSYTRVATNSEILSELSDSSDDRKTALNGMVEGSKGWTALYDGVRMGNETLGKDRADVEAFEDVDEFCAASDRLGIVVFTDGQENNSADEQDYDHTTYPGDGIDTTLDDLLALHVGGQTTPIYTVGMGKYVDHDALESLSGATGGRHKRIEDSGDIKDAFSVISDYFEGTTQVCAEIDTGECGDAIVEVTWAALNADGGLEGRGTVTQGVQVDCPVPDATGGHAVILMTLSNPRIAKSDAAQLVKNAVGYVSPVEEPKVLVVLDDNHRGEFKGDADFVAGLMKDADIDATRLDEPSSGISSSDLAGYDIVWFTNPGYPVDDKASMDAIAAFAADGGGVVLQGDDMSWSMGHSFSMTPYTGLKHTDNGTRRCGKLTDNNKGVDTHVTFDDDVLGGFLANLTGRTWRYGDDIDITTVDPDAGVTVAATADLSPACSESPAIVIR